MAFNRSTSSSALHAQRPHQLPLSPSASAAQAAQVPLDPSKQAELLATLNAQGHRVLVDLGTLSRRFKPEQARALTPSQLYDHLVAGGVPSEDARVLRAQEVSGANFHLINEAELERWGIAPWGRRAALINALQALAFEEGTDEPALRAFDANRELAALSLNNGGLANGYGLGERYQPTEREILQARREREMRGGAYRRSGLDDPAFDPRDDRVRSHSYLPMPSPAEEFLARDREREMREREQREIEYRRNGGYTSAHAMPRGLDRYQTLEDREYEEYQAGRQLYSPSGRSLAGLGAGAGALSIRERELELQAREREREEAHLAREAARHRSRSSERRLHRDSRPRSAGVWKAGATDGGYGPRDPRDYGSPYGVDDGLSPSYGRTGSSVFGFGAGTRPLAGTMALRSPIDHPGRTFEQAERERAMDRAALARRDRELLEAGRFGASLGSEPGYGLPYDDEDAERVYHNPRAYSRNGYGSYYKSAFGAYAEPLGSTLGGGGGTQGSQWLDEFYRPVDVRGAKSQWLSSLQPPSYSLRNNPAFPEARLKLEWIYGYKSFDCRNNLCYNNVGDIIYPVGSTMVVYKHAHRSQRHFQLHNDEIRCLAQHPINLNVLATGQTSAFSADEHGAPPSIIVWDSTDFSRSWSLALTKDDKAIRCLAFSSDGRYLVSVSSDAHHTLKIWEWETRRLLGSSRGDSYPIYAIKFNHKDPAEFVTVGKAHAVFWRWDGAKLTARKAHLPSRAGRKDISFYSVAFSNKGYACLGGEDGSIYVFVDGRLVREFMKLHAGKIFALDWFPGGLISGGGDGKVNILDKKLDVIRSFDFHHRITSVYARGNHLLIGTQGSQIFEIKDFMTCAIEGDNQAGQGSKGQPLIPLQGGMAGEWQSPSGRIGIEPIVQGHYDGETHALAVTPGGREMVSAGEDNQLCVWELTTHRLLRRAHISDEPGEAAPRRHRAGAGASSSSHPLHQCARSVAVSPNGKFISVGTNDGSLVVFTSQDLRRIHSHDLTQYSKRMAAVASHGAKHHRMDAHPHWVSCMKYSPSGATLAIGTHGAVIVLLDTRDEYRVKGVLSSHTSFLTALDWSEDGTFLASTDGSYALKFHQIFEGDLAQSTLVLDPRLVRDVKWANQNCVLGYAVQGILETGEAEGYLISTIEVSPSRAFVASGDDAGQVQLFRFPVLEKGHQSHAYHAHASQVVTVRWSADEKYVLSAGGHDNALCQWVLQ